MFHTDAATHYPHDQEDSVEGPPTELQAEGVPRRTRAPSVDPGDDYQECQPVEQQLYECQKSR